MDYVCLICLEACSIRDKKSAGCACQLYIHDSCFNNYLNQMDSKCPLCRNWIPFRYLSAKYKWKYICESIGRERVFSRIQIYRMKLFMSMFLSIMTFFLMKESIKYTDNKINNSDEKQIWVKVCSSNFLSIFSCI